MVSIFRQSSRKQPPREFRKAVATRAGRLPEWTLVSDQVACVADETKPLLSPSANQRRNSCSGETLLAEG